MEEQKKNPAAGLTESQQVRCAARSWRICALPGLTRLP